MATVPTQRKPSNSHASEHAVLAGAQAGRLGVDVTDLVTMVGSFMQPAKPPADPAHPPAAQPSHPPAKPQPAHKPAPQHKPPNHHTNNNRNYYPPANHGRRKPLVGGKPGTALNMAGELRSVFNSVKQIGRKVQHLLKQAVTLCK